MQGSRTDGAQRGATSEALSETDCYSETIKPNIKDCGCARVCFFVGVCVRTGIVGFVQRFAGQKSVSLWSLLRRAALALCIVSVVICRVQHPGSRLCYSFTSSFSQTHHS